jgi:hypothetical protein
MANHVPEQGADPPAPPSPVAIIAYRLQAEILGDLDTETLRLLKKLELAPSKDEAVPLTKALCERRRKLSPAAVGQAAAE